MEAQFDGMFQDVSEDNIQQIVIKHGAWNSSSEEEQTPPQKELNFFGFKFNLENIRNRGFQNPKFAMYLFQACSLISFAMLIFFYGYATNWDILAYSPCLLSWSAVLPGIFFEFNQSCESDQSTTQKLIIISVIRLFGVVGYSFAIIYVLLFNTPFGNTTVYLTAIYPCFLLQCFISCLGAKYQNQGVKQQTAQFNYNQNNTRNKKINGNSKQNKEYNISINVFGMKKTVWFDKWKIYGQRFWEAVVLSVMYIDVLSDIYCGFVLFRIYGAMSTFLHISGIALLVCCAADLMLVLFMLIFPGRVNHFAHMIAFAMEIPNFILTGISIWKIRQLIFQNQIENLEGQQLAIFSVVTTLVDALIHVVYIVDSWAVKTAIEFVQTQRG